MCRSAVPRAVGLAAALTSIVGVVGCARAPAEVAPAEDVTIPVSLPVEREGTDYVEFTGRTNAVQAVDIRPRVTE